MQPAAVGFQCPSCVREGSKATRSGRTAYGGQRSGNPALTSQVLIAINVAVWVAILATGGRSSQLLDRLALRPSGGVIRLDGNVYRFPDGVAQGEYWQVLTSMFTHLELWHIGFNMMALYVLGPALEAAVGRTRFLAVYFVSGLAGSATVLWLSTSYTLTLGASGAIFGLMGALLVIALKVRGDVRGMLTWIGINFAITLVFVNNISWQGHVGGFVGGLLTAGVVVLAPKERRTTWQLAGITLLAVAVVVATIARIAQLT